MVSYTDIIIILGAAVVLFGPKDVPIIARSAGRLTGRAVGTLTNFRARLESATDAAEITAVQRDLREGLTQLNAIRDEIRTGFHPLAPGPLAQRALRGAALGGDALEGESSTGAGQQKWRDEVSTPRPWSGVVPASSAAARPPQDSGFAFLPISAAALGRTPCRVEGQHGSSTGGDIMEEALAEERLAHEAAQLVSRPGALDAAAAALAKQRGGAKQT